ncbi:MAG: sigma-70 family RNA polymerase sigma factor [Pirellulales bacterium]|nr:sigma-70 family RNA polymerase sigma factor [Pirellulales bacterium]
MTADDRNALFRELITRHQRQLYGYLYALVHNHADAEDLLQQTSVVLWRKFDQFDPDTKFINWATRSAYFEACNFLRTRRKSVSFSDELLEAFAENFDSARDDSDEYHEALEGCVEEMPDGDRWMIDQAYGEDLSAGEIAKLLGRSRQSVSNSLRRIRQALLACIRRTMSAGGRR